MPKLDKIENTRRNPQNVFKIEMMTNNYIPTNNK